MAERLIRVHQDHRVAYTDHLNAGETVVSYIDDAGDIDIYVRRGDEAPFPAEAASITAAAEREASTAASLEAQRVEAKSQPRPRPRKASAKKTPARKSPAKAPAKKPTKAKK